MDVQIELTGLTKYFGDTHAVGPVSLSIKEGEFVSLLGPSGCGKTTTLRMIAGFEDPTEGHIRIQGRDVVKVPIERRGIGMVFQSYALFPHLSIAENVAFGLRLRKVPREQRHERVGRALQTVGLQDFGDRLPDQLSGGQQQRAALARALVIEPSVLLLDEPLSNLDLKLREQMRDEIRRIQRELAITTVYVTHDQGEAMAMSDRVAIMNQGRIDQVGAPRDIYEEPATLFVAGFIGQCNVLRGALVGERGGHSLFRTVGQNTFAIDAQRLKKRPPHGKTPMTLLTRPESVRLVGRSEAVEDNVFDGVVTDVVYLGERANLTIALSNGNGQTPDRLVASSPLFRGERLPSPGDRVTVEVPPSQCIPIADVSGFNAA